jgi:hypothetical protein
MDQPPYTFPTVHCHAGYRKAFGDGAGTKVIIITPRTPYPPGARTPRYRNHINAIRDIIRLVIFKNVQDYNDNYVIVHTYSRGHGGDNNAVPPHEGGKPKHHEFMNGKFMLQYDPKHDPALGGWKGQAALEVWAELNPAPIYRRQWTPLACQYRRFGQGNEEFVSGDDEPTEPCPCLSNACGNPVQYVTIIEERPSTLMNVSTYVTSSSTTLSISTTTSSHGTETTDSVAPASLGSSLETSPVTASASTSPSSPTSLRLQPWQLRQRQQA